MKRAYTIYSNHLSHAAKEMKMDPVDLLNIDAEALLAEIKQSGYSSRQRPDGYGSKAAKMHAELCAWHVDLCVIEGKCRHLFMPSIEFCNWLVECVPSHEPSHMQVLQELVGLGSVGILHFPSNATRVSVAFTSPKNVSFIDREEYPVEFSSLRMCFSKGGLKTIDYSTVNLECTLKDTDPETWYVKLIVALGMYCSCFPETLIDGVPEDLKHPAMHKYKDSKTFTIADQITSAGGSSPSAHFRRGHFRVLRSEKFTNKRYDVIFIRQTFVNGHAKTVLSPEEVAA